MGTGYTRNDTSNNIADGNIINAADLDGEFDAIESALGTSGHTHDGTSAEGGPVTVLGPVQDFVASATEIKPKTTNTLDIGTNSLLFKDMFLDGVATIGSIKIDNAGTIGSASDGDAIAISSGGVVSFSQNTIGKTSSGYVLALQTSDTTIEATNVLGKIEFSAPNEASGTDAILVGASIEALAEDTFDSSTNSSALVFKTNTTGAATERMRLTGAGDLHFLDNRKAIFGAGSDLQIYHDGAHSYISDQGTGHLKVFAEHFFVNNSDDTEQMIGATVNGAVDLFFDGSKKLATTNTGVDITGTLTSDGLTVDGATAINSVAGTIFTFTDTTNSKTGFINWTNDVYDIFTNGPTKRLTIAGTGDISFYEDTGTTPKFFWDSSAESLGIGTSSPAAPISISGSAFNPAAGGYATGGIDLQGATAGNGNYTAGLGFRMGTRQSTAIITGVQDTTDSDRIGLAFFTNPDGSGATAAEEAMRIDSSGNVGIRVVPEAWLSAYTALQIGDAGSVVGSTDNSFVALGANAYLDSTNSRYEYINSDFASQYYQVDGTHVWRTAASGTADAAITFDSAMTLDASGNLLVGKTSSAFATAGIELQADAELVVTRNGSTASFNRLSDGNILDFYKDGSAVGSIGTQGGRLTIGDGATGLRIAGDLNTIVPWNTTTNLLRDSAIDLGQSNQKFKDLYLSGTINKTAGTGTFAIETSGSSSVNLNASNSMKLTVGNSDSHQFINGTTQAMTLDSSGNLLVGKTSSDSDVVGFEAAQDGHVYVTVNNTLPLYINRQSGDEMLRFASNGATVGSIGSYSGVGMYTMAPTNGGSGLLFYSNAAPIYPIQNVSGTATISNGVSDLGAAVHRFKDLYLSGGVKLPNCTLEDQVIKSNTFIFKNGAGTTEYGRFDSSGNVGIAAVPEASYAPSLTIKYGGNNITSRGNADFRIMSGAFQDGASTFQYSVSSFPVGMLSMTNGGFSFQSAPAGTDGNVATFTTKAYITPSGAVIVGNSGSWAAGSDVCMIESNGLIDISRNDTGTQSAIAFYNPNGGIGSITVGGSATSYNTSSDYRLKTDAQPMTNASDRVLALNPVNFEWIADGSRVDGFLAHEAQAVVPEAVTGTKDAMMDEEYEVTPAVYEDVVIEAVLDDEGNELEAERSEQNLVTEAVMGTRSVPDYQGIDQSKLVPLLTAALQEALTEITALKARVTALEG